MSAAQPTASLNLGQALDAAPWSAYQKFVLVLAALSFAADGLSNTVLALAIPALIGDWHVPREAFASIAGAGLIGIAIGAVTGGLLGDRAGRRTALIGSILLFGLASMLAAWTNDTTGLLIVRFFAGVGIGGAIPNGTAVIAEFTPAPRRSVAIGIGMVFVAVGGLLASVIASLILPTLGWRGFFQVTGAIPIAVGLLLLFVLPESPHYLVRHTRHQALLRAILVRCNIGHGSSVTYVATSMGGAPTPLGTLFSAGNGLNTIALWVAFFFCLLASYTLFSWVPAMLSALGFDLRATSVGMTAFNLGGVAGGVVGGWLIGVMGSRRSTLGFAVLAIAAAVTLGLLSHGHVAPFATLLAALMVQGFMVSGLHNGIYTLAAHLYPPFARATGVGAGAAVGRLGAVVSSFTGVMALRLGGASAYFMVVAVAVALSMLGIASIRNHIPREIR